MRFFLALMALGCFASWAEAATKPAPSAPPAAIAPFRCAAVYAQLGMQSKGAQATAYFTKRNAIVSAYRSDNNLSPMEPIDALTAEDTKLSDDLKAGSINLVSVATQCDGQNMAAKPKPAQDASVGPQKPGPIESQFNANKATGAPKAAPFKEETYESRFEDKPVTGFVMGSCGGGDGKIKVRQGMTENDIAHIAEERGCASHEIDLMLSMYRSTNDRTKSLGF